MIKVKIKQTESNGFEITVQGHAEMGKKGSDILCAAVSTLYETLTASIASISKTSIVSEHKTSGYRKIVIDGLDSSALILINSFEIGCLCLEKTYPENIQVEA